MFTYIVHLKHKGALGIYNSKQKIQDVNLVYQRLPTANHFVVADDLRLAL